MPSGKKPRIAVLGCGFWGKNLVRCFNEAGALAAVADTDPAAAKRSVESFGVPAMDVESIFSDFSIDAVAIAVPAAQHAELSARALDAGKHVFVEKPLALTVADAELVVRRAVGREKILMVGHLLQYHPAFVTLKELVRKGRIGRLQYLYSNRLNLGKMRREENALWSFAPHDISMILSLIGTEPETVSAIGASYLHKTIADVTTTHLSFAGGEEAHVFVSWMHPFKEQRLVVIGDGGMAVFNDGEAWQRKLLIYPHRIEWLNGRPEPNRAEAQPVAIDESEPLKLECEHFLECVAANSKPRTDGEEGLRVLRVLEAAEQSMRCRSAVQEIEKRPAAVPHPGVFIHDSAYIDEPCSIGPGTKIWHFSHVLKHARIGANVIVGQNVMIGPDVVVGDRCKIQNNVSLYTGVILDEGVFCGPSCVFTNVNNPRAEIERKNEFRATRVGKGTTIGANATIVCGHDIGEYAFIAAGAVVTSAVSAHALMAGVPARRIGWVSHAGERLGSDLVCPREGRRYRECREGILEEIT